MAAPGQPVLAGPSGSGGERRALPGPGCVLVPSACSCTFTRACAPTSRPRCAHWVGKSLFSPKWVSGEKPGDGHTSHQTALGPGWPPIWPDVLERPLQHVAVESLYCLRGQQTLGVSESATRFIRTQTCSLSSAYRITLLSFYLITRCS